MWQKPVYLIALLSVCFNIVCSIVDETYTIEIKDGVKYVHNHAPLWGDEPKIKLELVQKIGADDSLSDNYFFFRPTDVVVDADRNIYVPDSGSF